MCACPIPSAGQGRSGVLASQIWTCPSTMVRPSNRASAGSDACDAIARPAPAAIVVVRTSRRDNMGGLLLRCHSDEASATIVAPLHPRCNGRQPLNLVWPHHPAASQPTRVLEDDLTVASRTSSGTNRRFAWCALANGRLVAKWLSTPLTDPRQSDIVRRGPGSLAVACPPAAYC